MFTFTNLQLQTPNGDTSYDHAIAQALETGKRLHLGSGAYPIDADASVIVPQDNLELVCEPGAVFTTIPTDSGNHAQFRIAGRERVHIRGGVFIGDKETHLGDSGEQGYVFEVLNARHVVFENCIFKDAWGDMVYISHQDGNPSEFVYFINCWFENARRNNFSAIHARQIYFDRCVSINADGTAPRSGGDFEPSAIGQVIEQVNVSRSLFKDNWGTGLIFYGMETTVREINVVDSYFIANGIVGLNLSGVQQGSVRGCTVKTNGGNVMGYGSGIYLRKCKNITLSANTIDGNLVDGVRIDEGCENIILTGNRICNHPRGVDIRQHESASQNIVLMSNVLDGNDYGIYVGAGTDSVNVLSNIFTNTGTEAVHVEDGATNIVQEHNIGG